jgi:hypothetical protein
MQAAIFSNFSETLGLPGWPLMWYNPRSSESGAVTWMRNMPWVVRGDRKYFYQSARVGGRRTKTYLGSGPLAEEVAAAIDRRRRERAWERAQVLADEQRHALAVAPLEELCQLTDLLMKAALVNAGFHQHARHAWRRRRHAEHHINTAPGEAVPGGAEGAAGEGQRWGPQRPTRAEEDV